jgi:hypothetical protein
MPNLEVSQSGGLPAAVWACVYPASDAVAHPHIDVDCRKRVSPSRKRKETMIPVWSAWVWCTYTGCTRVPARRRCTRASPRWPPPPRRRRKCRAARSDSPPASQVRAGLRNSHRNDRQLLGSGWTREATWAIQKVANRTGRGFGWEINSHGRFATPAISLSGIVAELHVRRESVPGT